MPGPDQDLTVMKWSILWRTIILSALGKTLYPYCRHMRELDLRDLKLLFETLDEPKFRSRVAKQFFAGDLARFHYVGASPKKKGAARLDMTKILLAVGDEITQHAPLLEGLLEPSDENVLISALPTWTPRLGHLRSLEFYDGKLLADETIRNLLHAHCPHLHKLQLYTCSNADSDHQLAAFIGGLQENTLTSFENNSYCGIGSETCLALNQHGKSLTELKLSLEEEGMLALGVLGDCTALTILEVTALRQSVDLRATQNDVFLQIVEWLKHCSLLRSIGFENVVSAPDLLLPILNNNDIKLRDLAIKANESSQYLVKDHHEFHKALSKEVSLRELSLRADPDPMTRDDIDVLMDTFSALKNLTTLNLYRVSDYFSNQHITQLAQSLPMLETLYVGGYGISDSVLGSIAQMEHIRSITFAGITAFTIDGLLDFVEQLPESRTGLVFSVEAADPDTMIPDEGQELVKSALAARAEGRFEYMPLRGKICRTVLPCMLSDDHIDPNMPEFDESDSD